MIRMNELRDDRDVIQIIFPKMLVTMIIYEMFSSLSVMTDGIIMARFLGSLAVAAHGLTTPLTYLVKLIGSFFATGNQIVCTSLVGKSDLDEANHVFSASAKILCISSILLAAFVFLFSAPVAGLLGAGRAIPDLTPETSAYLRGLAPGLPFTFGNMFLIPVLLLNGDKKWVNVAAYVIVATNISGDLLNVFLFNGSIFGMALVTSISDFLGFLILAAQVRKSSGIHLVSGRPEEGKLLEIAKAGFLPCFTRCWSLIKAYLINIIYLSFANVMTLAANNLVQSNIKVLFICVATAVGQATLAISGLLYTEKDVEGLKHLFKSVLRMSFGPCLLLTLAVMVFAAPISSFFGASAELVGLTAQALRIFMIGLPFITVKLFYIYYFQSSRNNRLSMASSVIGECVYLVALSFIFVNLFGTAGLWAAYPAAEVLYLLTVFFLAARKYGHFPKKMEEFLFLDPDFDVPEQDKLYFTSHTKEEVIELSSKIHDFCRQHRFSERVSALSALCVEEMGVNVFEHDKKKRKHRYVDFVVVAEEKSILFRMRDNCSMFNPKERAEMLDESDKTKNIGLRIVFGMASEVTYVNILNMNNLTIRIR